MKLSLFGCLVAMLLLSGCGRPVDGLPVNGSADTHPRTLLVFAAASLTGAFEEIGGAFEAEHAAVHITFNFAGSQALQTQIEQGAPADVFASADTATMDSLVTAGFVRRPAVEVLLTNQLVVILPASNPARLETLQDLGQPGVKLVLAAPDVPVGKYARQSLQKMNAFYGAGFDNRVLANVVSNEDNVKQVVAKVQLGEADAGIVYRSDAVAAPELRTIEIPPEQNVQAEYQIAPLADSKEAELAAAFVNYVLSTAGRVILAKWGFMPVP